MRWLEVVLCLGLGTPAFTATPVGDMPGRAALKDASACAACHREDASSRWAANREFPCTPYCLTCHPPAEMDQHHTVGVHLAKPLQAPLRLTEDHRMACSTCHHMAGPRLDTQRWRAESLFGRLFRTQDAYPTYFLVLRNDRGQLCRACH